MLKVAKPDKQIVDVCSGGGYLSIFPTYLLPKCNIILLENKSESMKKATVFVDVHSSHNLILGFSQLINYLWENFFLELVCLKIRYTNALKLAFLLDISTFSLSWV